MTLDIAVVTVTVAVAFFFLPAEPTQKFEAFQSHFPNIKMLKCPFPFFIHIFFFMSLYFCHINSLIICYTFWFRFPNVIMFLMTCESFLTINDRDIKCPSCSTNEFDINPNNNGYYFFKYIASCQTKQEGTKLQTYHATPPDSRQPLTFFHVSR